MVDLDLYTAIAVFIVVSIHLLKCSSREMRLNKWLSPLSVGWIVSGLTMFLPLVHKGALVPMAVVYFLMGALIVNTLVLSIFSKLPEQWVQMKSPAIEQMGDIMLRLMGTGLHVIFKQGLIALFRWIDTLIERQQMTRLGSA